MEDTTSRCVAMIRQPLQRRDVVTSRATHSRARTCPRPGISLTSHRDTHIFHMSQVLPDDLLEIILLNADLQSIARCRQVQSFVSTASAILADI